MNLTLNRYLPFYLMKSPIFCLFWTIIGHFSYSTTINYSLTIELNYFLNWISRFFLNWIIFWIESRAKQYWIEYWMNHFLAKFKYWIESDWVPDTTMTSTSRTTRGRVAMTISTLRRWKMWCQMRTLCVPNKPSRGSRGTRRCSTPWPRPEAQKVWSFRMATFNAQKLSGRNRSCSKKNAQIVFATKKVCANFFATKKVHK